MNFRALPKIDLHRHLEGSIRFDTFCELAREVGIDLSRRELRRRTSMRGEKPGFLKFLSKFELYRGLYPSREWIERVAFEAVEDAREDGVVYLELRFSPTHFGRRMKAKGEDVASWVVRGARRAGIDVRFIATYGRDFTPAENGPTTCAVEGTDFFSGLDLAGNEARPASPFRALFRRLKLPATMHAGEAGGPENVRKAVDQFGARRIGHGVRVLADPEVVEYARRKKVHFETCLTSEIQTGAARGWVGHPARRMFEQGLSVSLNSDDPEVCGVRLSEEFGKAARCGWPEDDLKATLLEAASAAFLGTSERKSLASRITNRPSLSAGRDSMIPTPHDR